MTNDATSMNALNPNGARPAYLFEDLILFFFSTIQVLAKAETLTAADQVTIATITIGAKVKVLVDTSQTPPTVLSVQ